MKFRGSIDDLMKLIEASGIDGQWTGPDGKRFAFRTADGAILNWWIETKTVQFQGPAEAKERLSQAVALAIEGRAPAAIKPAASGTRPEIFVVHGHDVSAREQLELVLRRVDLAPYVLMNTAGRWNDYHRGTREKKIGKSGAAQFGIVLPTPDDVGYAKRDGEKEAKPRPRQNVIMEMGMLLSSLTREHVAILVKGFVEVPSDAAGIIYLHFNDHVKEVVPKLAERLQASGIPLSPAQISSAAS